MTVGGSIRRASSTGGQEIRRYFLKTRMTPDLLISSFKDLLISGLLLAGATVANNGLLAAGQSVAPGKLYLTLAGVTVASLHEADFLF